MSKRLVDTCYLNDLELLHAEICAVDAQLKLRDDIASKQVSLARSGDRIATLIERINYYVS